MFPAPENPTTPEECESVLRATLERLREIGWLKSYTINGYMPGLIVWTDKGEANLALLRHLSLQARLTKEPGIARVTCWLAESFGPDIKMG